MPSSTAAKRSGAEVGVPSSLRTCRWTSVAPASNAAWVDSTCSATLIGTAGLSAFFGSDPVIATEMMQGVGHGHLRRRKFESGDFISFSLAVSFMFSA